MTTPITHPNPARFTLPKPRQLVHKNYGPGPWVHCHGILTPQPDRGRIYIARENEIVFFSCRNSSRSRQNPDEFWNTGGPCPPSSQVAEPYRLNLDSRYSALAKSKFFPIEPNEIHPSEDYTKQQKERNPSWKFTIRSEIGIHKDNGAEGSLGCNVLWILEEWTEVAIILSDWFIDGIHRVPFYQTYYDPRTEMSY